MSESGEEESCETRRKDRSMAATAEGNFVQPAIPRFDGHYDQLATGLCLWRTFSDLRNTGV